MPRISLGRVTLSLMAAAFGGHAGATVPVVAASTAQAAATPAGACIQPLPPPPPDVPWKNVDELCARANRGAPWKGAIPPLGPDWVQREEAYSLKVQTFLRGLDYRKAPYAWLRDADWRMTGEYEGCPPNGINRGPHPAVRIYYSPEVIDWMCKFRRGDNELPNASQMPDGAMIIKEMISPGSVNLALVPGTDKLWIAPQSGKPPDYYDQNFDGWTVMIKGARGSSDGWYWAFFGRTGTGNPPTWDRSAFTTTPYPGSDGQPVTRPPADKWYPTYWQYSVPDVQYPNTEFGNYCVYCHASAQGQTTFSSFTNILGKEIRYRWIPTAKAEFEYDEHERTRPLRALKVPAPMASPSPSPGPRAPFPAPRPLEAPLPGFTQTFPELNPPYQDVWASRLPAHTWDHAESQVGLKDVPPRHSLFLTSDQCESCHEAGGSGQLDRPYMVVKDRQGRQIDLSPWAEWSVSPMGLGGRDPIFHAQLELERNLARNQPGLAARRDCIDNTCLHCHGASGARQYNIDTAGQGPAGDPCRDFLPPKDQRAATDYDGKLFTQKMVYAWRDEQPELARYGGLARDGINCTICHRVADVDLDQANLPKTFTGNFRTGPADKLFGPFPNPNSTEPVRPKPMEHALGITPEYGRQVAGAELCGTCHTVFLPVFDRRGDLSGTAYEQTTYLEWLLSAFNTEGAGYAGGKSCQDCHMGREHNSPPITTGIANVQDTRYPAADFLLPAADVDIPERPYNRHSLYGLNAFLNAFFQQFPLLLGHRQQDYMNPFVQAPLLTGRETVLDVARTQTARLSVGGVAWNGDALQAAVRVQNIGGHNLPSGVGFRRLFVEFLVLDARDQVLWASGRTNDLGVILDGTSDQALPTEWWRPGADGLPFQPHHQVITSGSQVQIYEEITQNQQLEISSSFLHRYWEIKDNRLRAAGWNPSRVQDPERREEYGDATRPGRGPEQHWWPKPTQPTPYRNPQYPAIERYTDTAGDPDYDLSAHEPEGLPGSDTLRYRIALTPEQRAAAASVRVTLYSQSAPPAYLRERFAHAAQPGAEKEHAQQLYFITGHLNTAATADDGEPYLDGYKLRVDKTREWPVPPR